MDENYSNLLDQINKIEELINKDNNKGTEKEVENEQDKETNSNKNEEQLSSSTIVRSMSKKKIEKMEKFLTLDSVVYDIFDSGENKNKNYEKISNEIKRMEFKNNIEKEKLKKKIVQITERLSNFNNLPKNDKNKNEEKEEEKIDKLLDLQKKKLEVMEFERDKKFNFLEVVQRLKVPPEKRTIRDILRIKTYITQSKLGITFIEEFTDTNIVEKLINFCSIEMLYQRFKKGEVIFRIGEPPDSFYSIIFGKVNILKPKPKIENMTGFQYFNYLMDLKKNKEFYIFNECIKNNKKNFAISLNDVDIIHYIYLLRFLEHNKINNGTFVELDKVLDLLSITPEELGIDPNQVNSNFYINNNLKKIIRRIPPISNDLLDKYHFIDDKIYGKDIIVYEYNKFLTLKTNNYFGDSAIETNTPRNATVIAEEETDIAYLPNKLYYAQIASEKALLLEKKITSLHSRYFFNKVKYNKFSKKYYYYFLTERFVKNDIIFYERETIKYIYFIQEGSVELSTSRSINEMDKLINICLEKKKNLNEEEDDELYSKNLKRNENQKDYDFYSYNQISSHKDDLLEYLNQKKKNKLGILNKNEDIGALSYFLGKEYLITCKVISNHAKVYKIDVDYLKEILRNEYDCKEEFIKRMKEKLQLLSQRIFEINNIKLIMIDGKVCQDKLDIIKEHEKQMTTSNSSSFKSLINFDKLNDLFNKQKENNISNINSLSNKTIDFHGKSSLTFSSLNKIRTKNLSINFPNLNSNRIIKKNNNNFFLPSITNDVDGKEGSYSSRLQNYKIKGINLNKIKKFDLNQENKKLLTKRFVIEENFLSKIQKEIKAFANNKHSFLREIIKTDKAKSKDSKRNINESSNNKDEKLFLTLCTSKDNKEDEVKKKELSSFNLNNDSTISHKMKIQLSERNINKENSSFLKCSTHFNFNALSNDYNRSNTENNLKKSRNISLDACTKTVNKISKKFNHPYYDPLTLVKMERYKIFGNNNILDKLKSNYLDLPTERIKELKKIRASLKNNFRIKYQTYNARNKN